jgi:hypothetical protein
VSYVVNEVDFSTQQAEVSSRQFLPPKEHNDSGCCEIGAKGNRVVSSMSGKDNQRNTGNCANN